MKSWLLVSLLFFSSCTVNLGGQTVAVSNAPTVTINGDDPTTLVPASWCEHIPSKYQHYFPACQPGGNPALAKPVVTPLYSTAANWNDYIKADGSSLCTGSETGYDACLNGGELRQALTGETNCTGLSMTDSAGAFSWICGISGGVAVFTSSMKTDHGLQSLISGTSFVTMSVTLSKGTSSISSDSSSWWANSIATLPNNSTDGSAVSVLNSAGTIYVTSSDIDTSGYNIQADKVSVVTLNGSTIFHNGTVGCNAHTDGSVGNDARTIIATGSHKFLWLEGNYDENDSAGGATWTVFLSSTLFSKMKLLHSMRGTPLYLYFSNNNVIESALIEYSAEYGVVLDTSNHNAVLNLVSDNNSAYGIAISGASNNYVYNHRSSYEFGGVRMYIASDGNVLDELLMENDQAGLYMPGITGVNVVSNMTVRNVLHASDAGVNMQASDGQILMNIWIDTAPYGIMFNIAHNALLSNVRLTNCDMGLYTYSGDGTNISGEMWYDGNTANCTIIWGVAGYDGSSCAAANDSTFTVVTSSSNVFGYRL